MSYKIMSRKAKNIMEKDEVSLQRAYYTRTASAYEEMHAQGRGEHDLSCALIHSMCLHYNFKSILDVGSGTGRAVRYLSNKLPSVRVVGIEPVPALRAVGYNNGIPSSMLVDGDATKLNYPDSCFDLVCELGVLHHLPCPRKAVAEMLRVARRGVFISDSNRFGHGSILSRYTKLLLWKFCLWPFVNWIKTRGRGYNYGDGDGVAYSYSVFDDYAYISSCCRSVMVFNLDGAGRCALTGAPHVGILALK
jgi:ubiquinone/menaquinone biosynthesis C-methylase UbiE